MRIPRSYVESYSRALNVVSERARAALVDALSQIDYTADVASIREAVIAVMQPACGASATMAARIAAEFYDGLRERFGIEDGFRAEAHGLREPEATSGAVRAFAHELDSSMPNVSAFQQLCVDRIDYETRRAANECMAHNAKNDPRKPRWARVPAGAETCPFCIMLASRGFAYHSEETASHAHAHCDCRVVPSWDKSPLVQGYDPDEYYDMWKHPEEYTESSNDYRVESPYFDNKTTGKDANHWTVNYTAVEKKTYRDKFDSMPYSRNICDSLHKEAIEMLKKCDSKDEERLVAINARTGKRVASNYMDKAHSGWAKFNSSEERKVRACKDGILLLHNHPNSTYPSAADIISCCQRHASGSAVACHDGDVFLITVNEKFFPREGERSIIAIRFDELLEDAKKRSSDTNQAKNVALALLEAENEVERWYNITKL